MDVKFGKGKTKYGPGVEINLTGEEVATAIMDYLFFNDVHVSGPKTIRVNEELCEEGYVYVDPGGSVLKDGIIWNGRGEQE
jgi:hypothetical protein